MGNGEGDSFPDSALEDLWLLPHLQVVQGLLGALAKQIPGITLGTKAKQYKTV